MLRWMLRVDSWLDVASLENVEKNHSFLFPKKNLMKIFFLDFWIFLFFWKFLEILNFLKELKFLIDDFFFLKNLEILNFFKELKILIDDFFFFWKQPKKYEPNAPSPKALFENFLLFFPLKELERIFFWKIFSFVFFFFFFFFFWNMKICSLSKSEEDEDEDEDGVKVMKIYSWWCFLKNLSFEWEQLWLGVDADCWISPCLIPAKR